MSSKRTLFGSTVMQKMIVAISGLAVVGFLIAHLAGNLLIFSGPSAFNKYAQGLRDLGALLWIMRAGILVSFVAHIVFTVKLKGRNASARPTSYQSLTPVASTVYSRSMIISGLSILAFLLFHLAHFTWHKVAVVPYNQTWLLLDGRLVHNAYAMAVAGFRSLPISIFYVLAVTMVFLHMNHAVQSAFQTLGFNHPRYRPMVLRATMVLSLVLWLGFIMIPISVLMGFVQ